MSASPTIYPVILSGGSGSRLWPLSREQYPKQLQAIITERTLLQDAAMRLEADFPAAVAPPILVCNDEHRFIVAEQLRAVGVEPKAIIIEPEGRNTAPAAAVAALSVVDDPEALLLIMPSDHIVRNPKAFQDAVLDGIPVAQAGKLLSFGVTPSEPSTAYGYIKLGEQLTDRVYGISSFVEKPNLLKAREFVDVGGYAWNSGIFLFPAPLLISELNKFEPEIGPRCQAALEAGSKDLFFFRLDKELFESVPNQSIDYGVMERTDKAAVTLVDMGWSDVGSWSALHAESKQDPNGNTFVGKILSIDSKDTYVRSSNQTTAVVGLEGIVVVVTDDAVLVADKAHEQKVKDVVSNLKADGDEVATAHAKTYRPWGWFQTVDEGDRFKVKRIRVRPAAKLSLQKHMHRSEHWVVVKGVAKVANGEKEFFLKENESTFIPSDTLHRLENPGEGDLEMIEVQSGGYVGEDDIVRVGDQYGRDEK